MELVPEEEEIVSGEVNEKDLRAIALQDQHQVKSW